MREKREQLVSGEISFVQKDFQQGMPRRPSLIGKESLAVIFKKFRGITPGDDNFKSIMDDGSVNIGPDRAIASVPEKATEQAHGIYYIPKSFSAPKRFHPIKEKATRGPASLPSFSNKTGMKPVKVYDYSIFPHKNSWSALLDDEKTVPSSDQKVEKAERSISSVIEEVKKSKTNRAPDINPITEPDFGDLMKELKGVSSQNNEVY